MRLIACSFPIAKVNSGWKFKGQHTGTRLAVHLKNVVNRFEITDSRLLSDTTDNASSTYSTTRELQWTLETSGIEWPALRNHIPCMAHVIQLALGAFMSSFSVKGRTKSWEAHERDQQFGQNESIDFAKSQRLRKEGNDRMNKVLAMRPGLAKIIEKIRISWHFESPETDFHIAETACCIDYADTWSVTPLVLQVYFRDHKGSLNNPNMDTQSKLMKYHADFLIGSTVRICSPIGNVFITLPSYH